MSDQTETRVPTPEMKIALEAPYFPPTNVEHDPNTGKVIRVGPHITTEQFGEVVGAVAAVMSELTPVGKGGTNTFHGYKYARMQDILQVLTPLMGKHGIVVFQYESDRNMFDDGKVIAITYRFIVAHKSGQTWIDQVPQTGMSPCRTSKGTFDDKAFAKCHTSARKYFLLSLFQVPTEDEADPDNEQATRRNDKPVPSPDGHIVPHLIEPKQRDTFDAWADRYLAGARTAKTVAELDAWDTANDDPLSQMDANEKGKPVYDRILREFDTIRAKLVAAAKPDPISTGPQQAVPKAQQTETFTRPTGMPNAEMEPEAFVIWAKKRMDAITGEAELNLVFENEISPGSDGLFKPDVDDIQAHYEARLAKLGG